MLLLKVVGMLLKHELNESNYIYISKFRKQPLSNAHSIKHDARCKIDQLLVQFFYSSY